MSAVIPTQLAPGEEAKEAVVRFGANKGVPENILLTFESFCLSLDAIRYIYTVIQKMLPTLQHPKIDLLTNLIQTLEYLDENYEIFSRTPTRKSTMLDVHPKLDDSGPEDDLYFMFYKVMEREKPRNKKSDDSPQFRHFKKYLSALLSTAIDLSSLSLFFAPRNNFDRILFSLEKNKRASLQNDGQPQFQLLLKHLQALYHSLPDFEHTITRLVSEMIDDEQHNETMRDFEVCAETKLVLTISDRLEEYRREIEEDVTGLNALCSIVERARLIKDRQINCCSLYNMEKNEVRVVGTTECD